ncbi:MAG: ABC transporter permease [Firmicutes bacterium]|nr:ABC transporter permease [Bacillota bacterium]
MPLWEATWAIWQRDVRSYWRRRVRIVAALARALLWLVVLGSGLRPLMAGTGMDYVHYILPGVLALTAAYSSLQAAVATMAERESGFLRVVVSAPVPRMVIVGGRALGGATEATLQGALVLLVAPVLGLRPGRAGVLGALGLLFLTGFALTVLGMVLAASLKRLEDFGVIANFVILPMYFLSGALYPIPPLPVWFKALVALNPLSYAVDALRGVLVGAYHFPLGLSLTVLALVSALMALWAVPLYSRE